jgi:hypothetical protein
MISCLTLGTEVELRKPYLGADVVQLPFEGCYIPCFKVRDTEVYLVVKNTLCSFTAFEVRPLITLTDDIKSLSGMSCYCRGTLYCSNRNGGVRSYEIGSLSS